MMWVTRTLRTLANEDLGTLAENDPLTMSVKLSVVQSAQPPRALLTLALLKVDVHSLRGTCQSDTAVLLELLSELWNGLVTQVAQR